jgi:hypothetical protein
VQRNGELTTPTSQQASTPRAVRWYSISLSAGALAAGAALLLSGSPIPSLGPVLLLAIATALCVNRFALFPSEHAATAEAAVVLAAVVGFRSDAPYLGPLVVALLAGPLDALHWEQRSFVRMAYNAGNRGWSALAAAGALALVHELGGSSTAAWVVAVVLTATTFAGLDAALSIGLMCLHGERFRAALAHVLDVDVLTFPIALVGAAAGIVANEVGWWSSVLVLLPAAFAPELVLARARARAVAARDVAALSAIVAVLATIALVTPVPATVTLAVLCALAVLLGIEAAPDRGALVPPLIGVVVVVACAVLDTDRVRVGAVTVAVVATGVSWWCVRQRRGTRWLVAIAVALGAALAGAQAAIELPRTVGGLVAGAAIAGATFEVVALLVAPARRRRMVALVWLAPVFATAVAGAMTWRAIGDVGAGATVGLIAAALVGWAAWGSPAWRSRLSARVARRASPLVLTTAPVVTALLAVGVCVVGMATTTPAWSWVGVGLVEVVVASIAAGVRQWRFAPWPRRRDLVALLAAAVVPLAAVAGSERGEWSVPVVVAVTMGAVVLIARGTGRRVADGARRDQGAT